MMDTICGEMERSCNSSKGSRQRWSRWGWEAVVPQLRALACSALTHEQEANYWNVTTTTTDGALQQWRRQRCGGDATERAVVGNAGAAFGADKAGGEG